eukprot:gnl/TRDRNA2_/TRDRNA2_160280_c0_seq1.p1 gnl/TRDRNA2_/TRDRNA2_160280_c0~~gnl/TRDRNA2_/TRDRNA2_160280_c0_seq1.p1  ORF type:complete len:202 (+),score=32.30 gnl/TRDRNA2_/TRDRNA2_160280_c0_seq1:14-619(+)
MAEASLVNAVKELQRGDPTAREQWGAYCDQQGKGVRDPSKHDSTFVQGFLNAFQQGVRFEVTTTDWVSFVKEGQRKSQHFKHAWAAYCQHYGGGVNDPAKHDTAFLISYLDFLGHSACMAMSMGGMGPMGGKGMKGWGAPIASTDPVKEQYISRIKAYQKSGDTQKQAWASYCESNLQGNYDPARHETSVLLQFITMYGVP